jgi:aldehyde dehydrogenase (NAD+)
MLNTVISYVAGHEREPAARAYVDKIDPSTGATIGRVACSGAPDVAAAVEAASGALDKWRDMRPPERGRILLELARLIRRDALKLVEIERAETGKPTRELPELLDLAAQYFEFYAGVVNADDGLFVNVGPDYHVYTRREPFGVVGVILPWNAPLHQAVRSIAPALAVGNTVVAKPSEHTSGSLVALARLAVEQAGMPPGVFNIIVGRGGEVGPAMVSNPAIRKISFIGSLQVGRELGVLAADRILPLTLELGGKSADIVFEDADLDAAARGTTRGFTWNSGQWCAAGTRILVQRNVHDAFVEKLLDAVGDVRYGPQDDADYGPIVTKAQFEKVQEYFRIAEQEGLRPAAGGKVASGPRLSQGWFIEPTVYTGVHNDMRIAREEIFGPVVVVIPFEDEADAIRIANDCEYGLAAGLWSRDISRVHRVAARLEAGRVVVNEYGGGFPQTPSGGYKKSGYGREQGLDALSHYTQLKSVVIRL